MKGLVLAGGSGTRLRPITHTSAKQLVPVANRPVLFYGLESLAEAGITQVGVVVGDTEQEIREAVGDGSRFGLDVTYIRQDAPLGLAHGVRIAREFLGDSDFVMYLGDNFIIDGIVPFVEQFRSRPADAQILLTRVSDPSAFGVAELDERGEVRRLVEKPEFPKSDLALVGVYLFTPAIHRAIDGLAPSARGELEITDAIQRLIEDGCPVRSSEITGYWKDTGNVADMLEVNREVLERVEPLVEGDVDEASEIVGRVVVARGAVVRNSRIIGPAAIGADCELTDCYIGPFTSVSDGCRVAHSEIEFSIVLPEASIEGVGRLQSSLIGRRATVTAAPRVPNSTRLVLGDHSSVRLPL
ncbi:MULTISPECIES: glucose-1-phosphate thymidylyltransferase [Streptomyces]|uniref:Glucose-1-phosphate thymidylyltransferase n=2 Tax=Streptomyces TaxID=1883 RepID=A0A0W7XC47_9ACTN|nr:glucose-1-phosphate thymidylyltransferase [Streptomyces silvensis]KUF20440.1 glucose-1-phosphate thymidylyltransferase [Streptomyces silvensis]MVO90444.1 glucose-1-phosphate thymidylyltransferase [Streptomyces typhae]